MIIGPTAVGKTALSIDLAMRNHGEIISADSRLFYRGMDIGTAKPSKEEQRGIPHHLIDFLNPDETFSLGEFQRAVYKTADEIRRRGHLPMMVGGTGQYVRAITEGWTIPHQAPDPRLRDALNVLSEEIGSEGLHRWLDRLDPKAAAGIDHRNVRRTVRALEVIFHSGIRFSEQRRTGQPQFNPLVIGLIRPRDELYARVDQRIEEMFAQGFIREVQDLLDSGYAPQLPSMTAIGYQEVCDHLTGRISLDEAITWMKRRTRAFVRRQANWFKPEDPAIHWLTPDGNLLQHVEKLLNEHIIQAEAA